jgi:hypothetical protein
MSTAEAPERLLLQYRLDSGVAVVSVSGEVDVSTCGVLRGALLRVVTDEAGMCPAEHGRRLTCS